MGTIIKGILPLLLVLTSCSAVDVRPDADPTPVLRVATRAELKKALLTINELPYGWEKGKDDPGDEDLFDGCKGLKKADLVTAPGTASADALFTKGDLGPILGQYVGSAPTVEAASREVATLTRVLRACPSFTTTIRGERIRVRIFPLDFPAAGDEHTAYRLTMSLGDLEVVSAAILLVRVRNHLLGMFAMTINSRLGGGRLELTDLATITRSGIHKVRDTLP